ncbi:Acid protease [Apiospora sp. TS-2023a]
MRTSLVATILFAVTHARQRAQPQLHTPDEEEPPSTQDPRVARANTAGGTITNELSLRLAGPNVTYTAEFGIGSPPQKFELGISSRAAAGTVRIFTSIYPDNPNTSSTSEGKEKYNVQDGNGAPNGAYGQFFTDTWQVGGNANVGNVSFAATANDTKSQWAAGLGGIMDTQKSSRHSLTSAFAVAGVSTTSAYSVWLGDLAGKVGSIVFGGIDTQEFQGTLTRLKTYPLQLDQKKDDRLGVQLSAVRAVSVTGTDVLAFGVRPLLLEILMGTSGITLPGDKHYHKLDGRQAIFIERLSNRLKRPLPILKHFSKRRWINPHATELEVKHPQPDAAEVVGFPWAFDRPVGWTELDAPVHPVELEGDYFYHQHCRSSFIPNRQDTLSSSTAVDTEEGRSAIARRESMIIPGGVSAVTSPVGGGGSTARDSSSYIASAITSPLRMSFIPGPDRIDIGVLADHPENLKDGMPKFPEESKSGSNVALDHDGNVLSQQDVDHEGRTVDNREDVVIRRTPSSTARPSGNSPQPPATPPSSDPRWL